MYLPAPPKEPLRILPDVLIYNLYPCEKKVSIPESYKDTRGVMKERIVNRDSIAFANIVLPYRDAEAYRKSSSEYVDFGTGTYINKAFATIKYHHFYGKGDFGGRYLTNVVIWHKQLFDGTNPETARMVIGNEDTLNRAMESILKGIVDIPYLKRSVPDIISKARSSNTGAIRYKGSTEWELPIWYILDDKQLWEKIML